MASQKDVTSRLTEQQVSDDLRRQVSRVSAQDQQVALVAELPLANQRDHLL